MCFPRNGLRPRVLFLLAAFRALYPRGVLVGAADPFLKFYKVLCLGCLARGKNQHLQAWAAELLENENKK